MERVSRLDEDGMTYRENGAALIAVVLITLALFAVGHGLLGLSLGELAAARAGVRVLEANVAAESSVNVVLGSPGPSWLDSLQVGGERLVVSGSFGRADGSATVWRLAREAWWIEGTGRVGTAEARTARLAWAVDPLERVLALRGAITVALGSPVTITGSVDAGAPAAIDAPLDPNDCDPWAAELGARYAVESLAPIATLPSADSLPSLGRLDFAALLAAADVTVMGVVTPTPLESSGSCVVTEPSNWGDPERPWRACSDHLALRSSAATLHVDGGVGQGVLIVDGDLVLSGGVRFYGLALASGALHVEGGSELVGLGIAAGGAVVAAGGVVRASACWATRALSAMRSDLGRLRAMPNLPALGPL
jgi:hypothetical protein